MGRQTLVIQRLTILLGSVSKFQTTSSPDVVSVCLVLYDLVILSPIILFCLPCSRVSLVRFSVCKWRRKSCRFRSESLNFYPQEGEKLFSLSRACCYFPPKKGSPCPRPPPLPFLSLFQLKSCLPPCLHAVSFAEMH